MAQIVVQHQAGSDPAAFVVHHAGDVGAQEGPFVVPSPYTAPVGGVAGKLLPELAWYLETYLRYPLDPNDAKAQVLETALEHWGEAAYTALFDHQHTGAWITAAQAHGYRELELVVKSNDPAVLAWPWQALRDPRGAYLALSCKLERRLDQVNPPLPLDPQLPRDRVNILLVTARPYEEDVSYQAISRPLVDLIEQGQIPAHVHILRPPTFDNLRAHLHHHRGFYHILHFDGHGGYGAAEERAEQLAQRPGGGGPAGTHGPQRFGMEREGALVFETKGGKPDAINARKLSELLLEFNIPLMVLNACQSAQIDEHARDPFASVATALVRAGVRGVVAMAYSLYVSAAKIFLPAFYGELFNSGDVSEATRLGRQQLFADDQRLSAAGPVPLKDFVVPVLYKQADFRLEFDRAAVKTIEQEKPPLPEEAQLAPQRYPGGFIGRGEAILKLERALRSQYPAVLISGLGGVGKSSLARGLLKWLADTGGLTGCLWLNFQAIRGVEFVINETGTSLFGAGFLNLSLDERIGQLIHVLRENEIILVWDNFENVAGMEGTYITPNIDEEGRARLKELLRKLRGGRCKVIITSRSEEEWLGQERMVVQLGGLRGEDLWEYAERLYERLGLELDRKDKALRDILKELEGHPLALDAVLPEVARLGTEGVLQALKENITALGAGADRLHAGIKLVLDGIPEEEQPLLIPLALHERFIELRLVELMREQVAPDLTAELLPRFFERLTVGGLVAHLAQGIYSLHPALTGYLRTHLLPAADAVRCETWQRGFVNVMGSLADAFGSKDLYEQRIPFYFHLANFHYALDLAVGLEQNTDIHALSQSLARFASNNLDFDQAEHHYLTYAAFCHATNEELGEAMAFHQLGILAEAQRNFDTAKKWYLRALDIKERLGNEESAATTYGQLGILAHTERDFSAAKVWYHKALAIFEQLGKEDNVDITCRQLGTLSQDQCDYSAAKKWYLKSLTICESKGNEFSAAITYSTIGNLAMLQSQFTEAEKWLLKAKEILERLGDEYRAASIYSSLGSLARHQHRYDVAEMYHLKSLTIRERLGLNYDAATSYSNLGNLAGLQSDFITSAKWYLKSIVALILAKDQYQAQIPAGNFAINYRKAFPVEREQMKALWEAQLGPFPEPSAEFMAGETDDPWPEAEAGGAGADRTDADG